MILDYLPATAGDIAQRTGFPISKVLYWLDRLRAQGLVRNVAREKRPGPGKPPWIWIQTRHHARRYSKIRRRRLANLLLHAELATISGQREYADKCVRIYQRFTVPEKVTLWETW